MILRSHSHEISSGFAARVVFSLAVEPQVAENSHLGSDGNNFGRCIQKSATPATTNYLYDGDNAMEEVDALGSVVTRYAQRRTMDEPLAEYRSGTASYFQADGLDSVTSLTSASGTISGSYIYDSFGNLSASTGTLTNPFRYTGREADAETGLYYYRTRYYETETGRFISEDPIKLLGGINFYRYVKNDPVDYVDPTGLECTQISPWSEIPGVWGPNGPQPYRTEEDGRFWQRTAWNFAYPGRITCICHWYSGYTRMRRFYRVPAKEQALFECPCGKKEYRTRDRTKEYEIDGPGNPTMPSVSDTTYGYTFQSGEDSGSYPTKNNVGCTCPPPAP